MKIPELLAPAGSLEAFLSGYEAGADAFYLGLGNLNARKRAKNFTEEEFSLAVNLAHKSGKKIYVTMNTLVFDKDISEAVDYLEFIKENRADAVIVQDIGLMSVIKEFYPDIKIHASTQMFCHNSQHVKFLKENGVSRVILPRELSIEEISEITSKNPCEYEIFVHGAMCFSFSGCCLFSSYLFGDSGNTGRCRQPCRYAFEQGDKKYYPFSMKDLCSYEIIRKICSENITALKIEGRLKNAEYVFETVTAYRKALDAIRDDRDISDVSFEKQRKSGMGYFLGAEYNELVDKDGKGTTGEYFGDARLSAEKEIIIDCIKEPVKGMRLRVQDSLGKNAFEGTLLDFFRKGKAGDSANKAIVWKIKNKIKWENYTAPFSVYKTGVSKGFDAYSEIRKHVPVVHNESINLVIKLFNDELRLALKTKYEKDNFVKNYHIKTAKSISSPLTSEQCERIFRETDKYPFLPDKIKAEVEKDIFVPVSELKNLRRLFYKEFIDFYQEKTSSNRKERLRMINEKLVTIKKSYSTGSKKKVVNWNKSSNDGKTTAIGLDIFQTPEENDIMPEIAIFLPIFVSEKNTAGLEEWITSLIDKGINKFIIPTYGWIDIFSGKSNIELYAGPFLYAVNSFAVDFLKNKGIDYFIVSPDMRIDNNTSPVSFDIFTETKNIPQILLATRAQIPIKEYYWEKCELVPVRFKEYSVLLKK